MKRILEGENVFEDTGQAFKEFKAHLGEIEHKRKLMEEIEKRCIPH